jgi:putative Mg2+ transporter-C (MgtC) family protein
MTLNPAIPLHSLDTEVLTRLGVAALIGLALGLDRELRGHSAGLRTHGLVCFAAAAMTVSILSLYGQLGADGSRMDPLRIFEGAGAFIGIVAAGLIVVSKGEVHNLTTAVHLWLAAIIGIACGAAQWPLVAVAALVGFAMLTILGFVEKRWLEPAVDGDGGRDEASNRDIEDNST